MYSVEYSSSAVKALKRLDRTTAAMMYKWIEKNIASESPRNCGIYKKFLPCGKKKYWKYNVGSYRIIAEIKGERVTIDIIKPSKQNTDDEN